MLRIRSGKRLPAEIPTVLPNNTAPVLTMVPIKTASAFLFLNYQVDFYKIGDNLLQFTVGDQNKVRPHPFCLAVP
jgi:hypothetical protein